MICDAHIHVGYFNRYGQDRPFYYSPRRVCSVLKKCGVDEFIYSSTSMQTYGVVFDDVHKEMLEVQRLFGRGAHPFLWVSRGYLKQDATASMVRFGFYEGIKLHGLDMSWIVDGEKLERILAAAEECKKPVIVHTGHGINVSPLQYLPYVKRHPGIRFNFAHGCPLSETMQCMHEAQNIFVDVSCMAEADIEHLCNSVFTDRILWGTDFPTLAARSGEPLTANMRRSLAAYNRLAERIDFAENFHRYLKGENHAKH